MLFEAFLRLWAALIHFIGQFVTNKVRLLLTCAWSHIDTAEYYVPCVIQWHTASTRRKVSFSTIQTLHNTWHVRFLFQEWWVVAAVVYFWTLFEFDSYCFRSVHSLFLAVIIRFISLDHMIQNSIIWSKNSIIWRLYGSCHLDLFEMNRSQFDLWL